MLNAEKRPLSGSFDATRPYGDRGAADASPMQSQRVKDVDGGLSESAGTGREARSGAESGLRDHGWGRLCGFLGLHDRDRRHVHDVVHLAIALEHVHRFRQAHQDRSDDLGVTQLLQ